MAEFWTATRQDSGHWLFQWDEDSFLDSDSDIGYDIWLDGVLLDTVYDPEYLYTGESVLGRPPALEIVPDESDVFAESDLYPPYVTIQWRGTSEAAGYLVQRYVGGSWVNQRYVTEKDRGWYMFRSAVLSDGTVEQYRVMATDAPGNTGTPISFSLEVTRNPADPAVDISLDSDGDILVSEGS